MYEYWINAMLVLIMIIFFLAKFLPLQSQVDFP